MTDSSTQARVIAAFDGLATEVRSGVVVPPVAQIASAGQRRRVRQRLALSASAVASVVVVVGIAFAVGDRPTTRTVQPLATATATASPTPAAEGTYRELVEQHIAHMPDRPVVVPRSLPEGYAMLNAYDYYPTKQGLPGIRICVMPAGATSVKGVCVGTDDESPWTEISVDGLRVVLVTSSPPETAAALEAWKALTYTSDWRAVGWLDQQRHSS